MILDPTAMIEGSIIKSPHGISEEQIQPNGVDCTLASVMEISRDGMFAMTETDTWVAPPPAVVEKDNDGHFLGKSGHAYLLEFREYVSLPPGVCALVQGRSTLNRNGMFVRGSVFDSGFNGYVGATMYCFQDFRIYYGARVAQILFIMASSPRVYEGRYSHPYEGDKLSE
jgi:dUTP pyrophosphatase